MAGKPQPVIEAPFSGNALKATIVSEVAPAARLELLIGANYRTMHALTAPYAVAGVCMDSRNSAGTRWHYAQRINWGALSMRGRFFVGLDPAPGNGEAAPISTFSSSSGNTTNDEIEIPIGVDGGATYPPGPLPAYPKSSLEYVASPTEVMDRSYELNGLDVLGVAPSGTAPYTEGFEAENCHGASGVLSFVADVSVL